MTEYTKRIQIMEAANIILDNPSMLDSLGGGLAGVVRVTAVYAFVRNLQDTHEAIIRNALKELMDTGILHGPDQPYTHDQLFN